MIKNNDALTVGGIFTYVLLALVVFERKEIYFQ